ncbi:MAG TPA: 5-formyltetrahydrofolate cyclo-ligase [Rhizomicrobium sp.]
MENSKSALRAAARAHRATLTRADFAEAIARFADEIAAAAGAIVAGYFPFRDEADPRALMAALSQRGCHLALPCVESGRPLIFRSWKMGDAMRSNAQAFGIAEPLASAAPLVPDIVLLPLLAFDAAGTRLGYGGGYYDRTLALLARAQTPPANPSARTPLRAIGVAYAGQEVPLLPKEHYDHPLDMIVTENGVRRFHRS